MSPITQPGSDRSEPAHPDSGASEHSLEDGTATDQAEADLPPVVEPDEDQPGGVTGRARWLLIAGVAAAVGLADLFSKWWALVVLDDDRVIEIVWTLQLRLVRNPGAAFSIAEGRGLLISAAAVVAVVVLLRVGRRTTNVGSLVALGLIIGGAMGNLVDRGFREGEGFMGGEVIDFIDLQWWPVFNLADVGVVVGAGLLILTSWQAEPRRSPQA